VAPLSLTITEVSPRSMVEDSTVCQQLRRFPVEVLLSQQQVPIRASCERHVFGVFFFLSWHHAWWVAIQY
jgi:hypothetical protein